MAKYVAVGVLAVIVLATVTYEAPEDAKPATETETEAEDEVAGAYGSPPAEEDREAADEERPAPVLTGSAGAATAAPSPDADASSSPRGAAPRPTAEPAPSPAESTARTAPTEQPTEEPEPQEPREASVTVEKGQTLSDLARELLGDEGRWRELYEYNRDRIPDPDRIRAGLKLRFPSERVSRGEDGRSAEPAEGSGGAAEGPTYEVSKGDTLYSIARRELGSGERWEEIAQLNGVSSDSLMAGMTIRLPN